MLMLETEMAVLPGPTEAQSSPVAMTQFDVSMLEDSEMWTPSVLGLCSGEVMLRECNARFWLSFMKMYTYLLFKKVMFSTVAYGLVLSSLTDRKRKLVVGSNMFNVYAIEIKIK